MAETPTAKASGDALSLTNASSVIFDKKWSMHLPVVGDATVELRILYTAPSTFTFSITVQVAGRTFNWSKDVSGNVAIPIKLVDDFGLEVDVAGWAVSSHQLSFDLLVKITGPFGFSVTLFHQRVNIPLPRREEINALASLDSSQPDRLLWQVMNAPAAARLGFPSGFGSASSNVLTAAADPEITNINIRFDTHNDNKDYNTRLNVTIVNKISIFLEQVIAEAIDLAHDQEFPDPSTRAFDLQPKSKTTLSQLVLPVTRISIQPTGGAGHDRWIFDFTVRFTLSDGREIGLPTKRGIILDQDNRVYEG